MATQAQVDSALKSWQDAMNNEQTAKATYLDFRQKALDCSAERDKYSLGWRKNQACHIDTRSMLYDSWDLWFKKYKQLVEVTKGKKAAYESIKAEWDEQVAQQSQQTQEQIELNLSDPDIQIAEKEKEAKESEAKAKNKRYLIIGGVIIVVVIGSIIIWKVVK